MAYFFLVNAPGLVGRKAFLFARIMGMSDFGWRIHIEYPDATMRPITLKRMNASCTEFQRRDTAYSSKTASNQEPTEEKMGSDKSVKRANVARRRATAAQDMFTVARQADGDEQTSRDRLKLSASLMTAADTGDRQRIAEKRGQCVTFGQRCVARRRGVRCRRNCRQGRPMR